MNNKVDDIIKRLNEVDKDVDRAINDFMGNKTYEEMDNLYIKKEKCDTDFNGRKEIFRALVGSHNYNLNTSESDKDYKIFVNPTFDDLYFNRYYNDSIVGEIGEYNIRDVRKIGNSLWKSNFDFMEMLFSDEIIISNDVRLSTKEHLNWIFNNKNELAKINLTYLFNTCINIHLFYKFKSIDDFIKSNKNLYEKKYGYDTKSAEHSIRILMFLEKFCLNNFSNFKSAIWMTGADKDFLLHIKNGGLSKDKFLSYSEQLKNRIENTYKEKYYKNEPNEELYEELILRLKEIVRNELV